MTPAPTLALLVALAAATGAAARYALEFALAKHLPGPTPWGTVAVNVSGALALGLLFGLATRGGVSPEVYLIVGTGFLGAYTTFSTWMYQTARLMQDGLWGRALWNALGSLGAGVLAAALGLWLGAAL